MSSQLAYRKLFPLVRAEFLIFIPYFVTHDTRAVSLYNIVVAFVLVVECSIVSVSMFSIFLDLVLPPQVAWTHK